MLNITNGVVTLVVTVNKVEKILFIPANQRGEVYLVDTLTNQAILDPNGFVKKEDLKPVLQLVWSKEENRGNGGITFISADGLLTPATTRLIDQARKITAKFTRISDLFTYLSPNQLEMLALDHLVNVFGFTADNAKLSCVAYLEWLSAKGTAQLKAGYIESLSLPTEVLKPVLVAAKPAKVRKPRKAKQLKSAEVVEAVATTVVKEETQIPATV
jgi:hypothetical protein